MNTIFQDARAMMFSGLIGASLFTINFIPAHILTPAGGGSPIGAIWGAITAPFLLATVALILRASGGVVIAYSTYSVLAIPTFVMGPPHVYKPIIAILAGLLYEIGFFLARGSAPLGNILPKERFSKWSLGVMSGFTFFTLGSIYMYLKTFQILGLPGVETLEDTIIIFAIVFLIIGLISTGLAIKAISPLENHPAVKTLRQE